MVLPVRPTRVFQPLSLSFPSLFLPPTFSLTSISPRSPHTPYTSAALPLSLNMSAPYHLTDATPCSYEPVYDAAIPAQSLAVRPIMGRILTDDQGHCYELVRPLSSSTGSFAKSRG